MFDCVVIGGGPAAMAAAVYLARNKISFALVAEVLGGRVRWSSDVENYLGFHLLDGVKLVEQFTKHLEDYRSQFERVEEDATKIEKIPAGFRTKARTKSFESKTLLIATGTTHRSLNIPGEKEFYGKGVTCCATCDAPLFGDKVVHVIGGGNSAMDAALFAEKYAREVTIIVLGPELSGDEKMKSKVQASSKIKVLTSTKTTQILGDKFVTGIGLSGPDGIERTIQTDGVFIEIGLQPVSDFIDFVAKDPTGQIVVDKFNATDVEGIWAAGDVTDVTAKQIAVAVGEGSKAAVSIIHHLQKT